MAWKTDIINWTKISEKTASLLVNECEIALKETNETAKSISLRADRTLSILLPIATGLVVYLFSNQIDRSHLFLPLTAILSLIIIGRSLYLCYKSFKEYKIAIPGQYPEKILRKKFIDNDFTETQQYINLIVNICEDAQDRIDFNKSKNSKRMADNTASISVLFLLPICPVVVYLLLLLF